MNNDLTSQSILSGILAGNDTLARWTGGQWVCDRGNCEYFLVSGAGEHLLTSMPGWSLWPETETKDDFEWIGTNYREYVLDCHPREVFGGVRYDLAVLRSPKTISGLIEIKRYWTIEDITKLARALFYLGKNPQRVQGRAKEGVLLESVFFGAFIWQDPTASKDKALPVKEQYDRIQNEVKNWWQSATTGGHLPIRERFKTVYGVCPEPKISYSSKSGAGERARWEAGAVCVCLSLNEDP
jgi:hypothetical protein